MTDLDFKTPIVGEEPGVDVLDVLAEQIKTEHGQAKRALKTTLVHALHAGDLLLEAKDRFKHGCWENWLTERCDLPPRTARRYMKLATHPKLLTEEIGHVADLSMAEALRLIQRSQAAPKPKASKPDERRVPVSVLRQELNPIIATLREEESEQADALERLLDAWESPHRQKPVDARVHPASNATLN